jgi:hypothetical protein
MAKIRKQAAPAQAGADMQAQPEQPKATASAASGPIVQNEKASTAQSGTAKTQGPKYTPTPDEQAVLDKLASKKLSPFPVVGVTEKGLLSLDHEDEAVAEKLLQNALGTVDLGFVKGLMGQLKTLASSNGKVSELATNFLLSVIRGIEPRDQVESMLSLQMAAIHQTFVKIYPLILETENASQQANLLSALNKLAKTFTTQTDALKNYRTKGEQKVVVQYVNVAEGAQAIVGDVHQQQKETARPANAPLALTHSKEAPVDLVGSQERLRAMVKRKTAR